MSVGDQNFCLSYQSCCYIKGRYKGGNKHCKTLKKFGTTRSCLFYGPIWFLQTVHQRLPSIVNVDVSAATLTDFDEAVAAVSDPSLQRLFFSSSSLFPSSFFSSVWVFFFLAMRRRKRRLWCRKKWETEWSPWDGRVANTGSIDKVMRTDASYFKLCLLLG